MGVKWEHLEDATMERKGWSADEERRIMGK